MGLSPHGRYGLPRAAAVFAIAVLSVFSSTPAAAQDTPAGIIEIIEPAEWKPVEPRGIGIRLRSSIRVVGRAYHPTGVNGVLINGDRAAVQELGGGLIRFVGYVRAEQQTRDVEVAAFTNDGRTFLRRFEVDVHPSDRVHDDPAHAWDEGMRFKGKRWAVVVGISEYQDSRISPLRYADQDARAVRDFLVSERAGLGGFPEQNVALLLNHDATYANVRTALFTFLKESTEDDQIIIYFAGHGVPDPERTQELYLLTYDTRVDNVSGTAFPMRDVANATKALLARDIIVITDACHSAGVGGQVAALRDAGTNPINRIFLEQLNASSGGLAIFTASQAAEVAIEGSQWGGGHGIFTYHLLDGLKGAADEDRDQIVTLGEMMEYTREKVRRETRGAQTPTISQTTFDQALPVAAVLDPSVYALLDERQAAQDKIALPTMFAVPESQLPRQISTRGALMRGMTLPGMGMFYVDRPGRGFAYALTSTYLVLWGALQEDIPPVDSECSTDNPNWDPSCDDKMDARFRKRLAMAGGVWLLGALDAALAAHRDNAKREALRRSSHDGPSSRWAGPRLETGSDVPAVRLFGLRF